MTNPELPVGTVVAWILQVGIVAVHLLSAVERFFVAMETISDRSSNDLLWEEVVRPRGAKTEHGVRVEVVVVLPDVRCDFVDLRHELVYLKRSISST